VQNKRDRDERERGHEPAPHAAGARCGGEREVALQEIDGGIELRRGRSVPSPWRAANERHAGFALPARERVIADLGIDAQPDRRTGLNPRAPVRARARAAARRRPQAWRRRTRCHRRSGRSHCRRGDPRVRTSGVAAAAGEIGFGEDPHEARAGQRDGARAKLGEPRAADDRGCYSTVGPLRADGEGVLGERAGELIFQRERGGRGDARWWQGRQRDGGETHAIGGDDELEPLGRWPPRRHVAARGDACTRSIVVCPRHLAIGAERLRDQDAQGGHAGDST
jgi:hypothetical protein